MVDITSISRRGVIAGAGLAPLIASAATAADIARPPARPIGRPAPKREKAAPLPAGERLGWAVVGLGDFATNQMIPAFDDSAQAKLAGFVSGNPEKLADYGRRHGVTSLYSYAEFDRIAQDPAVDVVYIVLPNALHADFAIRALKAGKHVFCEKPMALTVRECEAMIAAAKAAGRQLGIAYRAHFEPHNVAALKLVREGAIGTLRHFTSEHGRILDPAKPADQWRATKALAGGGSLYDIGIYALNAACLFAGADPIEVSAAIDTPEGEARFAEVEDVVSFRLRFPDGLIAACASAYSWKPVKRYRIIGTEASLNLDGATDYYDNSLEMVADDRRMIEPGQAAEQFAAQIDGFREAVRANRPHRTPGETGLRDVRLMQAIYRSAREGRAVKV